MELQTLMLIADCARHDIYVIDVSDLPNKNKNIGTIKLTCRDFF